MTRIIIAATQNPAVRKAAAGVASTVLSAVAQHVLDEMKKRPAK